MRMRYENEQREHLENRKLKEHLKPDCAICREMETLFLFDRDFPVLSFWVKFCGRQKNEG